MTSNATTAGEPRKLVFMIGGTAVDQDHVRHVAELLGHGFVHTQEFGPAFDVCKRMEPRPEVILFDPEQEPHRSQPTFDAVCFMEQLGQLLRHDMPRVVAWSASNSPDQKNIFEALGVDRWVVKTDAKTGRDLTSLCDALRFE